MAPLELVVSTGWVYGTRNIMFATFGQETKMFVRALDRVLEKNMSVLAGRLNR